MTSPDTAAKAAKDDTNEPAASEPADQLIPRTLLAVLCFAAESGGSITEKEAIANRVRVLDPEARILSAIEQAAAEGVILVELAGESDRKLTLTGEGWKRAMSAAEAKAKEELAKKDDELRAYKVRVTKEHELASEVQACEADLESAKAEVSAAKERLAEAHSKLAIFVRGEVQTSFIKEEPEANDGHKTAYEQGYGAFQPGKAEAVNPYPQDPQSSDWYRGYRAAKQAAGVPVSAEWVTAGLSPFTQVDADSASEALVAEGELVELRRGETLNLDHRTITAYERQYLVIDHDGLDEKTGHFLALPLYTKDEWQQLHEAKFGRSVEGIDQTNEAANHRQQGGEFCGRVVKLGRKKAVVGPIKEGLVIKFEGEAVE